MELIIPSFPFPDWSYNFLATKKCDYLRKEIPPNCKLIPLSVNDYILYNNHPNNVFKNNLEVIDILDNKSKFGKYMLTKFKANSPEIVYYNIDDETYYDETLVTDNMIKKPNKGHSSIGIERISTLNLSELKNHIVQNYIQNETYYSGHFLVLNGIVIKKVYFYSSYKYPNGIKKGKIVSYKTTEKLDIDDSVLHNIFKDLNYSGFACPEFIIHENKIIIFEINPRPGGSLVCNKIYLNLFMDSLKENLIKNKN